jgi:hypothetical protein
VNREPCGRVIPVPPEEIAAEADMQQRIDHLAERVRFRRAGGLTEEEKAAAEAEAQVGSHPSRVPPRASSLPSTRVVADVCTSRSLSDAPFHATVQAKAEAEAAEAAAAAASKKGKKGSRPTTPKEPEAPVDQGSTEKPLPMAMLRDAIALRLEQPDFAKGVIFDGLQCSFAESTEAVFEAIVAALGLSRAEARMPPPPEPVEPEPEPERPKSGKGKPKTPPGKKGAPPPEPEVPAGPPEVWVGHKKLVVANLALGRDQVTERAVALKRAEAAVAAEAAAAVSGETADVLVVDSASAIEGESAEFPAATTDAVPGAAGFPEPDSEEALAEAAEAMVPYEEGLAAYLGSCDGVQKLFLAQDALNNQVMVCDLSTKAPAAEHTSALCKHVVALPLGWEKEVPGLQTFAIVKKPLARPKLKPISNFTLFTVVAEPTPTPPVTPPADAERPKSGKGKPKTPPGKAKGGKKDPKQEEADAAAAAAAAAAAEPYRADTRWVIPPHSGVDLMVRFTSPEIGSFQDLAGFQVVGDALSKSVTLRGECAYAHISTDYRNVFYRKTKTRPPSARISRQYVISKSTFEFGPLLKGLAEQPVMDGQYPTNMEKFRITNNGLFDTKVRQYTCCPRPASTPPHFPSPIQDCSKNPGVHERRKLVGVSPRAQTIFCRSVPNLSSRIRNSFIIAVCPSPPVR